jgi:hypothetical protein
MTNKSKKFVLATLLTLGLMLSNSGLFAQPPGGPPPGGGGTTGTTPPCWEPECIPIDGGIGLLIATGALLGGRKLYGQLK